MKNIGDIADSLSQIANILYQYPRLLKEIESLRGQVKLMRNLLALYDLKKIYPHDVELTKTIESYHKQYCNRVLGQTPGYLLPPGFGLTEEEFLKIAKRNVSEKSFFLLQEFAAKKKKTLPEAFDEMKSEEITMVDTPNARRKTEDGK